MSHGIRATVSHYTLLIVLLGWLPPLLGCARADAVAWEAQVMKVVVERSDGVRELGSAVPLGGDRLVTNCHVLRGAARIQVHVAGEVREVRTEQRDAYRDLCFLTVPGLDAEATPMIEPGQTRVGLDVVAVGYSGGEFAASHGRIMGLHVCECDGGRVIQTSAPFDRGASGGGLFDRQGRLVGILTFKARSGGNFHFALPVGWLRHLAATGSEPGAAGETFWERPGSRSAYFLAACDLGAKENWRSLLSLAGDWGRQEPDNPEAWMALGRAYRGLGRSDAAIRAFQKVLQLDSTHAEAKWALQLLEFELGQDLLGPDGL